MVTKRMLLSLLAAHHHGNASRHLLHHAAVAFSQTSHRHSSSRAITTAVTRRRRRGRIMRTTQRMTDDSDDTMTQYTINDDTCPPTEASDLRRIVQKHIETLPKYLMSKPIARYNVEAFEEACQFVKLRQFNDDENKRVNVILDSGCGTGRSTRLLGEMFPDCAVIGIDRSLARLNKNREYRNKHDGNNIMYEGQNEEPNSNLASTSSSQTNNTLLLRADLIDFWHQCLTSSTWQSIVHVHRHYILYPNPYPKKARLKSRFYAHPAFPLLMLTLMNDRNENDDNNSSCDDDNGIMIVRSNWRGYLEEFAMAVQVWEEAGLSSQDVRQQQQHETTIMKKIGESKKRKWAMNGPARIMNICETNAMTNFEAKYVACGEAVYELQIKPGGCRQVKNDTVR